MATERVTSTIVEFVHVHDREPRPARATSAVTEFVHVHDRQPRPLRVTSTIVEFVSVAIPADTPEIVSLIPSDVGGLIQTTPFSSPVDGDSLAEVQVQITTTDDPTFSGPVALFTSGTELVEGAGLTPETAYLARPRQRGALSSDSEWGEPVAFTTLEAAPIPDTPTTFVNDVTPTTAIVSWSEFSHPDGTTTPGEFDPDNPLPWHLAVDVQVRRVSGSVVVFAPGPRPDLVLTGEVSVEDLLANTAHGARVRHQDGLHATFSEWSEWVGFTTPAVPVIRPATPEITIDECGPGHVSVSGSTYSHPESPASGSAHRRTRWVVCASDQNGNPTQCQSIVTATPTTSFVWPRLEGGDYHFAVEYEDEDGRWSTRSGYEECSLEAEPFSPVFLSPPAGAMVSTAVSVSWVMNFQPEVPWEFNLQISADFGATWEALLTESTLTDYLFTASGREDGTYLFRLNACQPSGSRCSDWVYLSLILDRSGARGQSYDLRTFDTVPSTWEIVWEDRDVAWTLRPGFGVWARRTRAYQFGMSGLAMKELGQPVTGEFTTVLKFIGNEHVWWPYRFNDMWAQHGGVMWRAPLGLQRTGTRSGMAHYATPGGNALAGVPRGGPVGGNCEQPCFECTCDCRYVSWCTCRGGAIEMAKYAAADPGQLYAFAVMEGAASAGRVGFRAGQNFGSFGQIAAIPWAGPQRRGMTITTNWQDEVACAHAIRTASYLVRVNITRENGLVRMRSQVLGPGLDPQVGYNLDRTLTEAEFDSLPCGYCGLMFENPYGVGGEFGVLFESFSATNLPAHDIPESEVQTFRHMFLGLAGSPELQRYLEVGEIVVE